MIASTDNDRSEVTTDDPGELVGVSYFQTGMPICKIVGRVELTVISYMLLTRGMGYPLGM